MKILLRLKIIFCVVIFCFALVVFYFSQSKSKITIKEKQMKSDNTKVEIEMNPISTSSIKVYSKLVEEPEFKEIETKEEEKSIFKEKVTYSFETKDISNPENITDIKTIVAEDYIIISFSPAKDIATSYEYLVESTNKDGTTKTEKAKIVSDSGIAGYNYVINNDNNTQAGFEVNKTTNDPILISNIQWDKDYFFHIRAIDTSGNYSENITYKIKLPSQGVRMQYIDSNTNNPISPEETIIGNVNEEYNVSKLSKKISGYKLVEIDGETTGKLKKEKINIKYKYAKNASLKIKYIDKTTGKELLKDKVIEGYEGKEYLVEPSIIPGYICDNNNIEIKLVSGINECNIYYEKLGKINIAYVDEITNEKIIPNVEYLGKYNEEYKTEKKELAGYEFTKISGKTNGIINTEEIEVIYYYKKIVDFSIKHINIETKEIIKEEKLKILDGEKVNIKLEEIEDYYPCIENRKNKKRLNYKEDTNEKDVDEKKKTMSQNVNIEVETNENILKEEEEKFNIIDEILSEEYEEVDISKEKNKLNKKSDEVYQDIKQQYDIVVDSKKPEYIIYYKKK